MVVLEKNVVFDKLLTELIIFIPPPFERDVLGLLTNQKNNIIQLIKNEILQDNLTTFGFYMSLDFRMIKLSPLAPTEFTHTGITTPRQIIDLDGLNNSFIDIVQYFLTRLRNLLDETEKSGLTLDRITELKASYHRVQIKNLSGSTIEWPLSRCRTLVYNPKNDGYCLLTALAAEAIKHKLVLKKQIFDGG